MCRNIVFISLILFTLGGCDNPDEVLPSTPSDEISIGSGVFRFNYQTTNSLIPMDIYYHVPDANLNTMPILFVFHGGSRNAVEFRNSWVEEANNKEFIVIAPKFSSTDFPGGDAYNLGNVFIDGDNPSPQTLNPEQDWTFSIIEPLFDDIKLKLENTSSTYNIFGFSAGGQFAHRFVMFKPDARFNKIVASGSGWYTVPDNEESFPYGFLNSPLENADLSNLFSEALTIQIGTLDDNPNAPALRRNPIVDQQGTNRYDRAFYMFNTSQTYAESLNLQFNWEIVETPGNGHNMEQSVPQASEILF